MNVLFLTIGGVSNISDNAVYPDLLRYFSDQGHSVYVVCQLERRLGKPTQISKECGITVLRVKTGNITKVNIIEKGLSTFLIGYHFKRAIRKFFKDIEFDLILYSTPPITIANTVSSIKKKYKSFSYLMLKDIFPQNAIDLRILSYSGWKSIFTKYFRRKEIQLYKSSDFIGCMSEANKRYLLQHNTYIDSKKVSICPNTINPANIKNKSQSLLRKEFNIPENKTVFIYGGNFGKPQNVEYIIEVLKKNNKDDRHFVLCGSGTDFYKLEDYLRHNQQNVSILKSLPKEEYFDLLCACDVGLIFLDFRFTIPNIPSRILDYMNYGLPVLASTDEATDLKQIIEEGEFGWWCRSDDSEQFSNIVDQICLNKQELEIKGKQGRKYLEQHFVTSIAYNKIIEAFKKGS
ncbi:glycosyltransferase family 4 protein [Francisella hispaniensis]|uniref:Putative glycosyltransferase n=1 Tax=Francisella hispaniensis TaxID=622488 RepID=F4BH51_9GAMM|nr:glycosyltransferase family 4 protein [Francisella hispaniensis]AEE26795.1 putative glycosyltransferase [Francisella hispaniensis]